MTSHWTALVAFVAVAHYWTDVHPLTLQLPIGGVFSDPDSFTHVAFKYAISVHNNRTDSEIRVSVQVKPVAATSDAYTFFSGVCTMMGTGIFTLIGQNSEHINTCAVSHGEFYAMPYITISQYREDKHEAGEFLFHMRPSIVNGIVDLIAWLNWRRFFYLYNSDIAFFRYQRIVEQLRSRGRTISHDFIHLDYLQNISKFQDLMRPYRDRSKLNLVLDINSIEETQEVLNKMAEYRLRGHNYNIIIIGMDAQMHDVSDHTRFGTTAIGIQLIDTARIEVREFYRVWSHLNPLQWPGAGSMSIRTEAAFAYDAVTVFTRAVDKILGQEPDAFRSNFRRGMMYNYEQQGMTCSVPGREWERGPMLAHTFRQMDFQGLTGRVAFDRNGYRKTYRLNLVFTNKDTEWRKFAHWTDTTGLMITDSTAHLAETAETTSIIDMDKKMSDSADADDGLSSKVKDDRIESNIKSTKRLDKLSPQCLSASICREASFQCIICLSLIAIVIQR